MNLKNLFGALAVIGLICAGSVPGLVPGSVPGAMAAQGGLQLPTAAPVKQIQQKIDNAHRAGEYQIVRRRRRKGLKTLGIIAGAAAAAVIINEAAKAERARKKREHHHDATRSSNSCHSGLRRHRHGSLGGRYSHRHDGDCVAYRPDHHGGDDGRDRVVQPSCEAGYEYVDGKCYRNEELDSNNSQQATYSGDYDRCAARYQSFRYSDGTYQPFGRGGRRLCPYLGE